MAIIKKTYPLARNKNFIRITNISTVDDVVINQIVPHDDVYDGYEITLLLTPTLNARMVRIVGSTNLGGNIILNTNSLSTANPRVSSGGENPIIATPSDKQLRLMWDANKNRWIEISRSDLNLS